ncbi:hypothetical protein [Vulcanisaeta sp. JCM 14467]|nr:hypothetical protein [Vulcanisaeta sp. JCM 14467]
MSSKSRLLLITAVVVAAVVVLVFLVLPRLLINHNTVVRPSNAVQVNSLR